MLPTCTTKAEIVAQLMRPPRGFTLLEMLVVMVLMGLVTTMALPAMQRWHDAVQAKAQLTGLLDALRGAAFRATVLQREQFVDLRSFAEPSMPAKTGMRSDEGPATRTPTNQSLTPGTPTRPIDPSAGPAHPNPAERVMLSLPTRWQVVGVDDVRFLSNGLCRGGSLRLLNERGDVVSIRVAGPLCNVEAAPTGEQRAR